MSDSNRGRPPATTRDGHVNLHESQGNKQVLANDGKTQAAIAAAIQKKQTTKASIAQ